MGNREGPDGVRGWGSWSARAAVLFVVAIGALLCAPPAYAATAPLTCDRLLGADRITAVEARDWQLVDNSTPLFPTAGTQCWWFDPGAPRTSYFGVGYVPATDAVIAAERERLLATGSLYEDGGVVRSSGRAPDVQAEFVHASWLFAEQPGYWFFAVDAGAPAPGGADRTALDTEMDAIMADLQSNVVAAFAPAPVPQPSPSASPAAGFTAETPSTLSGLRTVADVDASALGVGGCLAVAVVLAALVGLPGRLVESAVSDRYDEWSAILAPVAAPWRRLRDRLAAYAARFPRAVPIAVGLATASLFAAVIEPDLGWNGGSLRLVLSLLGGLVVENLLGLTVIAWWLARRFGTRTRLRMRGGSLLLVLATALLSRIIGFEPGFVFGFVLALAFVDRERTEPSGARDVDTHAARSIGESIWLLVLGVVAWLGYSGLVLMGVGEDVLGLFLTETMAGVAVGCLSALPLVLLPLRGLPGAAIWRRSRALWAVAQAVSFAVFAFIVLPLPDSWTAVGAPFALWAGTFAVYAALAVGLWAVIAFTPAEWLADADGTGVRELDGAEERG